LPILVASGGDLLHEKAHELAALLERLFALAFDLVDALVEAQEPRFGRGGHLRLLLLAGQVGLDGLRQEPQVVRLGTEVCQVGLKLRIRYVALGVEV